MKLTLRRKAQLMNTINQYRGSFGIYDVDNLENEDGGLIEDEVQGTIFIKNQKHIDLIVSKLFRKLKIGANAIEGEYKDTYDGFTRFKLDRHGRFFAHKYYIGCCYDRPRQCKHFHKLCTGDDNDVQAWRYNIANLNSVEDFLVSVVGFANSFKRPCN